jgi:hypothetical protein
VMVYGTTVNPNRLIKCIPRRTRKESSPKWALVCRSVRCQILLAAKWI